MFRELSKTVLQKKWTPIVLPAANFNRKARWHPVAKSKYYYIPKKPEITKEEWQELKRLNDNYHTQMRAVRRYYHQQMLMDKTSKQDRHSQVYLQQEAQEFERCMKLNDEWNAERARDREVRLHEEREKNLQKALDIMEEKDKQIQQQIERANILIRKEKEASKTFITCEADLEVAIEHALSNVTDYNFAIDLDGNRYAGREANSTLGKAQDEAAAMN